MSGSNEEPKGLEKKACEESCKRCPGCKKFNSSKDSKSCEKDCGGPGSCKDCEKCKECAKCVDCKECTRLKRCERCRDCEKCKECKELEHCKEARDCKNCRSCEECTRCADCKKCRECEDCAECIDCEKCKECKKCVNCKGCKLCENCKNCQNCEKRKNCEGCKKCGEKKGQESNISENKKVEKVPTDKILFDSMVSNEKEYLGKVLKSQMFEEQEVSANPCIRFFNWLLRQFATIKTATPSSTLVYNLEFLCKMTHTKRLFEKSGCGSKTEVYLKRIKEEAEEDYEAEDLDVFSLADASRKYIKQTLVFLNSHTVKELNRIYDSRDSSARRQFFMERLPYVMKNRGVFKLIKELISKLNNNIHESEMDTEKSISIWSDVVIDHQIAKEKRDCVLRDLLSQEFDYVPLRFYD